MDTLNLVLCAVSAAALDLCAFVMILTAYADRRTCRKQWEKITGNMELAEQGMTYPLNCDEILIGRHASADIRLPDISVSRYHAMLTVSDGVWTIRDMGSKSGIYVNGNLVKEAVLRDNDMINIGIRRLVFRRRRDKRDR